MKTFFVDAFTNRRFKGNPAAVCMAESGLEDATMQDIATEIGFSETAFVSPLSNGGYSIRFFTPKKEIPICGHATLAASKIVFDTTRVTETSFVNCNDVVLKTSLAGSRIAMEFPVYSTEDIHVPPALLQALGVKVFINARYSTVNKIILLEIERADALASLQPHFEDLVKSYSGINGVLVTARSGDDNFDFHYRYFWPWAGTNEDPVTGGVQTFLTPYWAQKLGKTTLNAFQCSLRTGEMQTELMSNAVRIYGEGVTVFEGEFKW